MKTIALKLTPCPIVLVFALLAGRAPAQESSLLKTEQERQSYAIGADLARNIRRQGVQVQVQALLKGMEDVLSGKKSLLTDDELRNTLRAYQVEVRGNRLQAKGGVGAAMVENRAKGTAFLAENKTKAGVVTLPSGLQYTILKAGNGRKPTETETVQCHFRGMFIDGEEFNSSVRAGQPATLKVKGEGTISGVSEALQLMPVGSKWRLFIPSEIAYGEKGVVDARGRVKIEPNATLIYELELVAIK
jgi:UDP-GlcNAc:undecaprenyl-phosphate/decaprenyl-phosphate GlcNAc-1-phosphate transferase